MKNIQVRFTLLATVLGLGGAPVAAQEDETFPLTLEFAMTAPLYEEEIDEVLAVPLTTGRQQIVGYGGDVDVDAAGVVRRTIEVSVGDIIRMHHKAPGFNDARSQWLVISPNQDVEHYTNYGGIVVSETQLKTPGFVLRREIALRKQGDQHFPLAHWKEVYRGGPLDIGTFRLTPSIRFKFVTNYVDCPGTQFGCSGGSISETPVPGAELGRIRELFRNSIPVLTAGTIDGPGLVQNLPASRYVQPDGTTTMPNGPISDLARDGEMLVIIFRQDQDRSHFGGFANVAIYVRGAIFIHESDLDKTYVHLHELAHAVGHGHPRGVGVISTFSLMTAECSPGKLASQPCISDKIGAYLQYTRGVLNKHVDRNLRPPTPGQTALQARRGLGTGTKLIFWDHGLPSRKSGRPLVLDVPRIEE